MASVKILHYTHKVNTDGTNPVVIQVIDGVPKKRTLANVLASQWDEEKGRVKPRSHPNYAAINVLISDEYNRIEKLILNNEFELNRDFVEYFDNKKKKIVSSTPGVKTGYTFKEICKLYVSSLKSGFSMLSYESRLKYFIEKSELGNLKSSQITTAHIDKFVKWHRDKGNQNSTIRTNLKIIRFASSFAAKHKYDTRSPDLHEYELPIAENVVKKKLNKQQLESFKSAQIKNENPALKAKGEEVQDMFMLAIYLRGMRIGDVIQIKQECFVKGRYVYNSAKSNAYFDIKLIPAALEIVEKYLDGREYLFHWFNWKPNESLTEEENKKSHAQHIKSITANINKILKSVAKDGGVTVSVNSHLAKHTFGKMAIDKVKDFNKSMDLLGHTTIKAHQTYIREINLADELDAAADDIFSE